MFQAQLELGQAYLHGNGIAVNPSRAVELFKAAASQEVNLITRRKDSMLFAVDGPLEIFSIPFVIQVELCICEISLDLVETLGYILPYVSTVSASVLQITSLSDF